MLTSAPRAKRAGHERRAERDGAESQQHAGP